MNKRSISNTMGFTLIELIMVIIILSILSSLALPKFANLSDKAHKAVLTSNAVAFQEAVRAVHYYWILNGKGTGSASLNNVNIFGDTRRLDLNPNGWPVQDWGNGTETAPNTGNVADCISVWNVLLQPGAFVSSSSSDASTSELLAAYTGSNTCRYTYNAVPTMSISYDSKIGKITYDNDPSS